MREIKFRAWNKIHKAYWGSVTQFVFEKSPQGVYKYETMGRDGSIEWYNGADAIFEQFTGLHDKNGKEIYEGDIVKIDSGYGGDYHYQDCIADIRYNWCNFYPHNNKDKDGCVLQDYSWDKDMEVIGNIHENPELLEASC